MNVKRHKMELLVDLGSDVNDELVLLMKTLVGVHRDKNNPLVFTLPATPMAAAGLVKVAKIAEKQLIGDALFRSLVESWNLTRKSVKLYRDHATTELPPIDIETKRPAWRHQLAAYWFSQYFQGVLLYMGMGSGKSKVVLDLIVKWNISRVLIVAPKSVISVWRKQIDDHMVNKPAAVFLNYGSVKERIRDAGRLLASNAPLKIVVTNYDAIWREDFKNLVFRNKFELVVADEIHKIKDPNGRASRFMGQLAKTTPRRIGLSGTPAPHSLMDLFGVMRFVDAGCFGNMFTLFKQDYGVLGGFQGRNVVDYQNTDRLNKRFYACTFRCDRDVLDLPPSTMIDVNFDLCQDARDHYNTLAEQFVTYVLDGTVTTINALVRLLRYQQITGGYMPLDDEGLGGDRQYHRVDHGKAELLTELFDDIDHNEPIIVFCRFSLDIQTVKDVATASKRRSFELSGKLKQLDEWTAATDGSVLAVQIQSGSEGVDLTRACYCIYYSVGFSLGMFDQASARIDRPGQTRPVTQYRLIANKTIDVTVYSSMDNRRDVIKSILENPRESMLPE